MKNNSININNLNLEELKSLLKELKLYSNLRKQLGLRGEKLYNQIKTGKKSVEVEFFPVLGENLAWEQANIALEKVFNLKMQKKDLTFVPKESLRGGIKIFVGDNVLDLSCEKIEKMIRK